MSDGLKHECGGREAGRDCLTCGVSGFDARVDRGEAPGEAPGEATLPDGVALNWHFAERLRSLGLDVERAEVVEHMGRAYVRLIDGQGRASLVAVRPAVLPEQGMEVQS